MDEQRTVPASEQTESHLPSSKGNPGAADCLGQEGVGISKQDQHKARSVFLYTVQRSSASAQFSIDHFSVTVVGAEVLSVRSRLTFAELFLFLETLYSVLEKGGGPGFSFQNKSRQIRCMLVMPLFNCRL